MIIAGSRAAAGSQKIIFLKYYSIRPYWEAVLEVVSKSHLRPKGCVAPLARDSLSDFIA
jgi:hypothetical protein